MAGLSVTGPAGTDATPTAYLMYECSTVHGPPDLTFSSVPGSRLYEDLRGWWLEFPAGTFSPNAAVSEERLQIVPDDIEGTRVLFHDIQYSISGGRGGVTAEGGYTCVIQLEVGLRSITIREVDVVPPEPLA